MEHIGYRKVLRENKGHIRKMGLWFISLLIIDQVTKVIAQGALEGLSGIPLINGVLSFYFLRNEILYVHQYLLYFIIAVIAFPFLIIYSYAKGYPRLIITGMIILWCAVFSNNIIDVFALGYIRDFINLHGVAVGNIADQYRNAGFLIIIAGLIMGEDKSLSRKKIVRIIVISAAALLLTALFWRYLAGYLAI